MDLPVPLHLVSVVLERALRSRLAGCSASSALPLPADQPDLRLVFASLGPAITISGADSTPEELRRVWAAVQPLMHPAARGLRIVAYTPNIARTLW